MVFLVFSVLGTYCRITDCAEVLLAVIQFVSCLRLTSSKVCNANISADVRALGPLELRISSRLTCTVKGCTQLIQPHNEEGKGPRDQSHLDV